MRQANFARSEWWPFTGAEIHDLRELTAALEPLESAVTALSSRSANIIDAEAIYEEVISEFEKQDTWISNELKDSFLKRVKERRNITLTHLVLYLQDPAYIQAEKDQFGEKISKTAILLLAKKKSRDLRKKSRDFWTSLVPGPRDHGTFKVSRSCPVPSRPGTFPGHPGTGQSCCHH